MNYSIDHELMAPPSNLDSRSCYSYHGPRADLQHFKSGIHFRRLKQATVISMCLTFALYRLFWTVRVDECIRDLGHYWTTTLNRMLNEDELFYQTVIIIAQ